MLLLLVSRAFLCENVQLFRNSKDFWLADAANLQREQPSRCVGGRPRSVGGGGGGAVVGWNMHEPRQYVCMCVCVAIYKYNVVVVVVVLGLLSTTVDYEMCVASAWLRPAPG